uniref:PDZ domain-containing protein n=1 Tax=Neolamprologus brichardi TaxID=32507 RepID=A0A3Q4H9M2_NEOBR
KNGRNQCCYTLFSVPAVTLFVQLNLSSILRGSQPAQESGLLREGDIILTVNKEPLKNLPYQRVSLKRSALFRCHRRNTPLNTSLSKCPKRWEVGVCCCFFSKCLVLKFILMQVVAWMQIGREGKFHCWFRAKLQEFPLLNLLDVF